jgi:hypothetical protein
VQQFTALLDVKKNRFLFPDIVPFYLRRAQYIKEAV